MLLENLISLQKNYFKLIDFFKNKVTYSFIIAFIQTQRDLITVNCIHK